MHVSGFGLSGSGSGPGSGFHLNTEVNLFYDEGHTQHFAILYVYRECMGISCTVSTIQTPGLQG